MTARRVKSEFMERREPKKVDEAKETVKEAVDNVKDAVKDKPTAESTPQE
jgi:hypothetical protein